MGEVSPDEASGEDEPWYEHAHLHGQLPTPSVNLPLARDGEALLAQAHTRLGLSMRSYHKTIRVARTIAALSGAHSVEAPHVAEALQYRYQGRLGF